MLLDRLFKFIMSADDEPVNPVLAGYFSKVVCLLINRKQKQVVPYIMADSNKVIESLLAHVYSRSVAEVIHRILHIVESNFDEDLSVKIAEQKQKIMVSLIDQLKTPEDETVMNAAFIL
jgi:serine/threonine-protein phosphatase 6 regulatory subunit 1